MVLKKTGKRRVQMSNPWTFHKDEHKKSLLVKALKWPQDLGLLFQLNFPNSTFFLIARWPWYIKESMMPETVNTPAPHKKKSCGYLNWNLMIVKSSTWNMLKVTQNQENSHIPEAINNSHDENSPILKIKESRIRSKNFCWKERKAPR